MMQFNSDSPQCYSTDYNSWDRNCAGVARPQEPQHELHITQRDGMVVGYSIKLAPLPPWPGRPARNRKFNRFPLHLNMNQFWSRSGESHQSLGAKVSSLSFPHFAWGRHRYNTLRRSSGFMLGHRGKDIWQDGFKLAGI